ncbi:hypothetical protein APASM_4721 [Actinosynnema pretiosum subsp. pretiosum]|nr:hypothetical protein APASM_4721 [Actinosynnema pretiosum subsp. pretiosum]
MLTDGGKVALTSDAVRAPVTGRDPLELAPVVRRPRRS